MNRFLPFIIILLMMPAMHLSGQEPSDHLRKKISVEFENTPIKEVLPKMGDIGGFQFSYNSNILPGDSIISIKAENEKVSNILEEFLTEDIRCKVLGNHIILLPEDGKNKVKQNKETKYTLSGYIYNSLTGEIISKASVYDVDERSVSSTNQDGFYSLDLPVGDAERIISYSKYGFNDTVIVIRPSELISKSISLTPNELNSRSALQGLPPSSLHERNLVAALVPGKAITASENVPVIEERFFQMSFLPFIGSNHVVSGLITNRLSINVLAGYSEGVKGLELGGLLNITRNNVEGVQLAGFGNMVGEDTDGVQMAGFFNINGGSFTGIQAAGFSNLVMDTIRGVQLAGFSNALRGPMYGPQISGFANFTSQNVDGTQISGFTNIAVGDVKAAQLTGFANVGIKDVKMVQAAGFANIALGDVDVAQVSGFANYCNNSGGLQISGFSNIASGSNQGMQISGFLNYATELKGVQLSFINISDTVSSGLPIGFFSFVRKGYHTIEITSDEFFNANIAFKTGIRKFYNIFSAGANEDWLKAGYGIGTQLRFSERWSMSFDLTGSYLLEKDRQAENIYMLLKFEPKLDFQIFKYLTLTAGPSLNLYGDLNVNSPEFAQPSLLFSRSLNLFDNQSYRAISWIGGTIGFRF